jgi:hypothetical protein
LGGSVGSADKLGSNPASLKAQTLDKKQWPTHSCPPKYRQKRKNFTKNFLKTKQLQPIIGIAINIKLPVAVCDRSTPKGN